MPTQRIVLTCSLGLSLGHSLGLSLGLATMVGVAAPALSEEYRGTWEQQMACTPDVMRLCSDRIPDVTRIVACLRENTASLGNSCRAVFESSASADQPARVAPPPPATPRPRATQPRPYDDQ